MFAYESGLADKIEFIPTDTFAADTDLIHDNPIGKVPALLTQEGMFASPLLCCEYLDSLHGGLPLIPRTGSERWKVLRLHALADGVMEAAVASVTERFHRPEDLIYPVYLERQREKICRILKTVEKERQTLTEPFDIGRDYTRLRA